MAVSDWDPAQYTRFENERAQPFWDLVALVDSSRPIRCAVDLGCGTGTLTVAVASRWAVEEMVGIDASPAMLTAAAGVAGGAVRFEHGDIGRWTAGADRDVVLANASLQWVGDHPAVLRRWSAALRPGGQLAVQVPANADHPSHLAAVAVAHTEPFLSAMGGSPPPDPVAANVLPPERYAELLDEFGFGEQHVRLQVYPHRMARTTEVVEWTKGTSLTRFFAVLPEHLHARFVDAYRAEVVRRLGDVAPYLFAFKRILMWGRLG